jgi:nicotinate-nucleotide adenylyltransferase
MSIFNLLINDSDKRRVGTFGSAFNPITRAHLWSALQVALEMRLDKIIFMASSDKRKDKHITMPSEHRWNLLNLAIQDSPMNQYGEPLFEVDRYEMDNTEDKQFSYYTMEYLKEKYPNDEVFFILGYDVLKDLSSWTLGKEVIENNKFIVIERKGLEIADIFKNDDFLNHHKERFSIIKKGISFEMSSSYIRSKFSKGENPQYLLEEKCYKYIIENKLYDSEIYINKIKSSKKRIGIFGSGFDPITIPELNIALEIATKMELEKVIFVPSSESRTDKKMTLSEEDRINSINLSIANCPKNKNGEPLFEVSKYEIDVFAGLQYTYLTMKYFKNEYKDYEVYLMIGEDVVKEIPTSWMFGRDLINQNQFIVMKRIGHDISDTIANNAFLRYHAFNKFTVVENDLELDIPNDYIKEDFSMGGDPKYLLPIECYNYIINNNLFNMETSI